MKKAFTLAEVLITLTIIGVIAALTIPTLMQKQNEHATVNKVKKFYATITNAYNLTIQEQGTPDTWNIGKNREQNAGTVYDFLIKPYFKVAQYCGNDTKPICISSTYQELNGTKIWGQAYMQSHYRSAILDDGTSIILGDETSRIVIFLDINGKNPPNTWGKDLFGFEIQPNQEAKVQPLGLVHYTEKTGIFANTGYHGSTWVIYKGNMDYLHKEVSW